MPHSYERTQYRWGPEQLAPWNSQRKAPSNYRAGRGFACTDPGCATHNAAPDITDLIASRVLMEFKAAGVPHAPDLLR